MSPTQVSPTVLVIEDEPVLRSSMVRGLLRDSSAQVVGAATIAEARRMIEELHPAFIISDLDLPDGTGLEILDVLDRAGLRVPILFASAYVPKYSPKIPRRSDIEVREKPIPLRELRGAVERSVGLAATGDGVGPFSATDYIQLACMCHRSVEVSLERDGVAIGRVIVRDGDLVHAECGGMVGEVAIRAMVYDDQLLARCLPLRQEQLERTIVVGWQAALLEAARVHDEDGRSHPGSRRSSFTPTTEPPFADDDLVISVSVPPGPMEAAPPAPEPRAPATSPRPPPASTPPKVLPRAPEPAPPAARARVSTTSTASAATTSTLVAGSMGGAGPASGAAAAAGGMAGAMSMATPGATTSAAGSPPVSGSATRLDLTTSAPPSVDVVAGASTPARGSLATTRPSASTPADRTSRASPSGARALPPMPRLGSTTDATASATAPRAPRRVALAPAATAPVPTPPAALVQPVATDPPEFEYQRAERLLREAEQAAKARPALPRPRRRADFERAYDLAVEALLARDYDAAYRHFVEAQYHEPDDRRVKANLERLRALGAQGEPR